MEIRIDGYSNICYNVEKNEMDEYTAFLPQNEYLRMIGIGKTKEDAISNLAITFTEEYPDSNTAFVPL